MTVQVAMDQLQPKVISEDSPSSTWNLDSLPGEVGDLQDQLDCHNLHSTLQVLGEHESYMVSFLRAHNALLKGDVPLSDPVRHFVALMAASSHGCDPLVSYHKTQFLTAGGSVNWLETGFEAVNTKVQKLGKINQILAHQPWTITSAHIEEITRSGSKDNWSLSELVYAIVLMAHFHSFSSFIESCVSVEDGSKKEGSSPRIAQPVTTSAASTMKPYDCSSPSKTNLERNSSKERKRRKGSTASSTSLDSCSVAEEAAPIAVSVAPYDCSAPPKVDSAGSPGLERVDSLVLKMEELRAQPEADSDELEARFERVKEWSAEIRTINQETINQPPDIRKFVLLPELQYVDFAQRERKELFKTFRVQDFNWDEQGFSVISRFYDEIAQLLDDKFQTAYHMTYRTMGRLTAIDTSMFRRATWNYIQCLFGIRWDDYDYSEVNVLLHRSLKKYIKTAACYPDRCSVEEYNHIMTDFQPSEKIHVCLLVAEAKFQSELLYALRAIAAHFSN